MDFQDLPQLQQLQRDLWKWPSSRAALMVGAGFSLNAQPKPGVTSAFPTWKQLTRKMFYELHPIVRGVTDEKKLEDLFNSSSTLRLASEYEATFGGGKLEELIRDQVPDSHFLPGLLHYKLMKLPWTDVFTTNYDTLLERSTVVGRSYNTVSLPNQLTTAFQPRIVKLHGCFTANTQLVITEEHFRRYPVDLAPFVNTVQQSLLENSFVLLGFSGDDPNFLTWIGWIRDELGDQHAPIYLVRPSSVGTAERRLLDRRGVTPIDLSPIVDSEPADRRYVAALDFFLDYLTAARPVRPEDWPEFS